MTVLVIGNHYWGHGEDLATAKRNFRKEGGSLSRGYTIVEFASDQKFMGVDPIRGEVSWKNDDGSDKEPRSREVKARAGVIS